MPRQARLNTPGTSHINAKEGKMQSTALKREAKKAIDKLSDEKIKVAIDFIDYLKEKEEMEATLEILSSSELMAQLEEADKAIKKGKLNEFIPWDKVKRNV
jgi:predicted acylesterase/phospholipase RssA